MIASRVHQFGPPNAIALEDVPIPDPEPGEILVRVRAAGVGPWDAWVRSGKSVLPQPLPLTLGSDIAGIVTAVGADVSAFAAGDAVFGVTNPRFTGACAEYAIASARMVAKMPRNVTFVEAASVPVVAVTAWQMLFDHAHVVSGQTVLIHGGAGNVGAYAVQLARRAGARVIATGLPNEVAIIRDLGADLAIDVLSQRFEDVCGSVDAVLDTIGGDTQNRSLGVVRSGGVLVSSVSQPAGPEADGARQRGVKASFMLVDVTTSVLAQLAALIDENALRVRIGVTLPLTEIRAAHEMLDGLRPRPLAKIVLDVLDGGKKP